MKKKLSNKKLKDSLRNCEAIQKGLPEKNEIFITEEGLVIIDVEGSFSDIKNKGRQIGDTVWCG